jgi:hypothetical protein
MRYIILAIGKLISIALLILSHNHVTYGQQSVKTADNVKIEDKALLKSSFHISGSGPMLASGLPVFINGRETTDRSLLDPKSIKSAQVLRRGDPRLIPYGSKGINGVLLIESKADSIKVGQPVRKH